MSRFGRKAARAATKRQPPPVPSEFCEPLERLRQATIDATEFIVPLGLFHDELATLPAFVNAGIRAENQKLRLVLERAVERLGPGCVAQQITMFWVGDFWHGFMDTPQGMAVFYYFATEDIGLVATTSGRTNMVRFSVVELPDGVYAGSRVRGSA